MKVPSSFFDDAHKVTIDKYCVRSGVASRGSQEMYSFKDIKTGKEVFISSEPSVYVGNIYGFKMFSDKKINLMTKVGKLAEEFHETDLYAEERLLRFALQSIPGNHPIFRHLSYLEGFEV